MSASLTTAAPANLLAEQISFTPDQLALMKDTVAKGATDNEFLLLLHLAKTYGLDPFAKEIWCIKYVPQGKDPRDFPATIFSSRDGYLKIASRDPQMDGITSDVVYENDTFSKRADGKVDHTYGTPRGAIIGAYALVWRKDRTYPAYFYAPLKEYNSSRNPTWAKYTSAMIVKVAEAMALKRAFSISGLVTHEEIGLDLSQDAQTDAGTGAVVVVEESPAKQPAGNAPAATASTSPAPSTTSGLSDLDEAKVAGHRERFAHATTLVQVQQIWEEIRKNARHLAPLLAADKDAAKLRLDKKPAQPAPATTSPVVDLMDKAALGQAGSLSTQQREEIVRLLALPVFTDTEKHRVLPVVYQLDSIRAGQLIFCLRNEQATREGRDADKEMRQALHAFLYRKGERLGASEVSRLGALVEDTGIHWQVLYDELATASASLGTLSLAA